MHPLTPCQFTAKTCRFHVKETPYLIFIIMAISQKRRSLHHTLMQIKFTHNVPVSH